MRPRPARIAGAATAVAAVAAAAWVLSIPAVDSETEAELSRTILVGGVYYEDRGVAVVSYEDVSGGTRSVVLEVLGMDETFHRTYESSSFTVDIPFRATPKYGWPVHPIVLVVDHAEYGTVDAKTEFRPEGEAPARIIYGVR